MIVSLALAATTEPAKVPKPQFQPDYFGEMARSFCTIQKVDKEGRALVVKRDKDSQIITVPIRDDTELRFRDSWGELEDFFPGQHVMLFVYVDEQKNWTYPRAVQDDIQVSALHGWYATVTAIDLKNNTYSTHREEKDKEGKIKKVDDKQYSCAPTVQIWKSEAATGIDGLKVGDEVIQQQIEKDGKLVVVEVLDRKGDAAVRAAQEARHRNDQDRLGLPGYVNDVEVLTGALTISVAWSGADRAKTLKPGDAITLTPTHGGREFAGGVVSNERTDARQRLRLAINSRVASRLQIGQSLRVFMPGTGGPVPQGKSGVPGSAYK
jgi:hypothetical protein